MYIAVIAVVPELVYTAAGVVIGAVALAIAIFNP
tara:strand:- start:977 stop:1078 length:102 start_codon:yes stop_codon:yes gene_type:complete